MQKSDLKELKKAIKSENPPFDWIYRAYVSADNSLLWKERRTYAELNSDEEFRHKEIVSKLLTGTIGKNLIVPDLNAQQTDIADVLFGGAEEDEFCASLIEKLLKSYAHTSPYYAVAIHVVMDVKAKAKDGTKLEDGENTFESLLFAICPAALSKPALGYESESGVKELTRSWTIGAPTDGFLYPSFNDRMCDRNETVLKSRNGEAEGFFKELFDVDIPASENEQKEAFSNFMDTIGADIESASSVQKEIASYDTSEGDEMDKQAVRRMIRKCGIDDKDFDEAYDSTVGGMTLTHEALASSSVCVSAGYSMLKIPTDKSGLIITKEIDGTKYICVPADGTVTVNGIPVKA